jgi:hypothetical protein
MSKTFTNKRRKNSPTNLDDNIHNNKKMKNINSNRFEIFGKIIDEENKNKKEKLKTYINSESDSDSDASEDNEMVTHDINKLKHKIPKIYLTSKISPITIQRIIEWSNKTAKFTVIPNGKKIVYMEDIEYYHLVIKKLKDLQIEFWTYTPQAEKPKKLVLKGIDHNIDPEDIKTSLAEQNVFVSSITNMKKDNKSLNMFLVYFNNNTNIHQLITDVKYVLSYKIRWDKFKKHRSNGQCRNCQRFGHAAFNCNMKYRCIKCKNHHEPGKCSKATLDKPFCINCKADHPANYRGCVTYKNWMQQKGGKYFRQQETMKTTRNSISSQQYNSSFVNPHINFSQAVRNTTVQNSSYPISCQKTNETNDFAFLQNEIQNLFKQDLGSLINNLSKFIPEYKKVNDPLTKKVMIISFLASNNFV